MKYSRVVVDAISYHLPPIVVTSLELEEQLGPVYRKLGMQPGQLEAITGVAERRWWEPGYPLSHGAITAGRKALRTCGVAARDLDVLIFGGVCREHIEPATACRIAAGLGVADHAAVYDVSNACLGVLNGMVEVANRIELGQARAGLVVSCESAREIVEATIGQLVETPSLDLFRTSLATLTGGSGAVAVLLSDGSFNSPKKRQLIGGVTRTAPEYHNLCRWGIEDRGSGLRHAVVTDSAGILKHGMALGLKTWEAFLKEMGWQRGLVDKVICHQVGALHRETVLKEFGIPAEREFPSFAFLGNMATVSLPLTTALAEEREFLQAGDRVGLLGIASGLNCLMLGMQW